MATTKKTPKKKKASVKFVSDPSPAEDTQISNGMGLSDVTDNLRKSMNNSDRNHDTLVKSVKPITVREDYIKNNDKSKVVFSVKSYGQQLDGVESKPWKRISDVEQKELAQVDPYISAIVSTRSNQGQIVGRRSESKFDKGTRIMDNYPLSMDNYNDQDRFNKAQETRERQKKEILDWVLACGTKDEEIIDSAYFGATDKLFRTCSFSEYVSAQIRNLLTFGRAGTQVFRDEDGLPLMFRPVPIETILPVCEQHDVHLGTGDETVDQSLEEVKEFNKINEDMRPAAYVQKVDGRNVNFLTDDQLKITYFQKQALFDLRGYPLSPIEQAIYMVFIHQNTLGYMRNQFVKGLGTKGILALEANDPSAELSKEDLDELRREFHNFLNRTDNSATTPVIAGPVKVEYIPLTTSPRDMEFLQIEEHVIRSLCASMQTSPQEMGYGHLGISEGGLTQSNKQDEIIQGEERGLRTLLDCIFDTVNEIVFDFFDDAEDKFTVGYTGIGEDTRDAVIERGTQELATTATMNSLWADSEKSDNIPLGGDVPLSAAFHQNVVRYMKMGDFMESFFGFEGTAKNPLYDFFIDPALDQAYQQRVMMSDEMNREGGEIQLETQKAQLEEMSVQVQMEEAQMGMQGQPGQEGGMPPDQGQEAAPQEGAPPEQGAPAPGDGEELQQSLADAYMEKDKLNKSMTCYFKEWIRAHK